MLSETTELRDKLEKNTKYFRAKMTEAGFDIKPGEHPIVPIMLYDAVVAQNFAAELLNEGIYVIGFFFPVVPKGQARIRVQLSAAHEQHHLDKAIAAFTKDWEEARCPEMNGAINQGDQFTLKLRPWAVCFTASSPVFSPFTVINSLSEAT